MCYTLLSLTTYITIAYTFQINTFLKNIAGDSLLSFYFMKNIIHLAIIKSKSSVKRKYI